MSEEAVWLIVFFLCFKSLSSSFVLEKTFDLFLAFALFHSIFFAFSSKALCGTSLSFVSFPKLGLCFASRGTKQASCCTSRQKDHFAAVASTKVFQATETSEPELQLWRNLNTRNGGGKSAKGRNNATLHLTSTKKLSGMLQQLFYTQDRGV